MELALLTMTPKTAPFIILRNAGDCGNYSQDGSDSRG